jgi:hypothetical protein
LFGYFSRAPVAKCLKRSTIAHNLRRKKEQKLELAYNGVCTAVFITKYTVSSYLTFSPLPVKQVVIFCCTFLQVTLTGI